MTNTSRLYFICFCLTTLTACSGEHSSSDAPPILSLGDPNAVPLNTPSPSPAASQGPAPTQAPSANPPVPEDTIDQRVFGTWLGQTDKPLVHPTEDFTNLPGNVFFVADLTIAPSGIVKTSHYYDEANHCKSSIKIKAQLNPKQITTLEGGATRHSSGYYFCSSYWRKGAVLQYQLIDDTHLSVTLDGVTGTLKKGPNPPTMPAGVDNRLLGSWRDKSLVFFSKVGDTTSIRGEPMRVWAGITFDATSVQKTVEFSNPVATCEATVSVDATFTSTEIKSGKGGLKNGYDHGYTCKTTWPDNVAFSYMFVDEDHLSVTWGEKTGVLVRDRESRAPDRY